MPYGPCRGSRPGALGATVAQTQNGRRTNRPAAAAFVMPKKRGSVGSDFAATARTGRGNPLDLGEGDGAGIGNALFIDNRAEGVGRARHHRAGLAKALIEALFKSDAAFFGGDVEIAERDGDIDDLLARFGCSDGRSGEGGESDKRKSEAHVTGSFGESGDAVDRHSVSVRNLGALHNGFVQMQKIERTFVFCNKESHFSGEPIMLHRNSL